jgi:hypothetical protein
MTQRIVRADRLALGDRVIAFVCVDEVERSGTVRALYPVSVMTQDQRIQVQLRLEDDTPWAENMDPWTQVDVDRPDS